MCEETSALPEAAQTVPELLLPSLPLGPDESSTTSQSDRGLQTLFMSHNDIPHDDVSVFN